MNGIVSDALTGRRLPSWMLGVAAAAHKEGDGDSKNNDNRDVDDGCQSREDDVKVKKRGGRRPKGGIATRRKIDHLSDGLELEEIEEKLEEPSVPEVIRGERKRTKRKLNLNTEDDPKKKKQIRKAKRQNIQSSEDAMTGGCLTKGEDEDLTVEDLMIFAKECVEKEGGIGTKEADSMKEETSAEIEIEDIGQSGKSIDVQGNKRMPEGQTKSSFGVTVGNVNVTSEASSYKPTMSGNPAEDMLNLFLGPLLKTTRERQNKVDLSREEMDFDFEMKRQENPNGATGEEQATVTTFTKKKSSLKDKVAMFLG